MKFTGGELTPLAAQDPEQIKQWLDVFGSNATTSQVVLLDRLKFWLLQKLLGMGQASVIDPRSGTRTFAIKKSPKGRLQLLYLDEELRITKGNRGTILVCQRKV
ncbi:MAG: PAP/fibrillin family protein [Cyanobacteria bacterium P01_G01_bin.67]